MVMSDVLHERATEVVFAHGDDPIQAFSLDGPHEAFGVRIGIGCADGRLHDMNAGVAESLANVVAPFAVAIADHHAMRDEEALLCRQ